MPMFLDPEFAFRQCADLVFDLPFGDAGADQPVPFDGIEQFQRLGLRAFQFGAAAVFDGCEKAAHDGIGPSRRGKINYCGAALNAAR